MLLNKDEKKIILWTDHGLFTIWCRSRKIHKIQININKVEYVEIFKLIN